MAAHICYLGRRTKKAVHHWRTALVHIASLLVCKPQYIFNGSPDILSLQNDTRSFLA